MTLSPSYDVPPGWYPDPSGARQWRVWNGTAWSALTRPYGEGVSTPRFASNLSLVQALRRLRDAGVVGVVGGLGLLVGVLAHWPGTAHPVPEWFALAASQLSIALLLVGSVVCAFGVRELEGRWRFGAFVPGVNFFIASARVTQRLGRLRAWRLFSEVLLLVVFVISSRAELWLFVGPMIVAYVETSWFAALIDQLNGPSTIDEKSGS
ncbi:MAG: DUF2510 domain-containing protein [Acidimicrobiales bacterium]